MSSRPKEIRGVFLLTCLKILISIGFYAVISNKGSHPDLTQTILYTVVGYIILAVPTFVFIHKRFGNGVRFMIFLALIVGIPAKAFIGIGIDIIVIGLTFTKPAKNYFIKEIAHYD